MADTPGSPHEQTDANPEGLGKVKKEWLRRLAKDFGYPDVREALRNYLDSFRGDSRDNPVERLESLRIIIRILRHLRYFLKEKELAAVHYLAYGILAHALPLYARDLASFEAYLRAFPFLLGNQTFPEGTGTLIHKDKLVEPTAESLQKRLQQDCTLRLMQLRTRENVKQKKQLPSNDVSMAAEHPHFPQVFTLMQKYGFPSPEVVDPAEVLDNQKPIIGLFSPFEGDTLVLARELDRQGGTNVVIPLRETMEIREEKQIKILNSALVYRDGKTFLVHFYKENPFEKQFDYIHGSGRCRDWREQAVSGNPYVEGVMNNKYACFIGLTFYGVATTWNPDGKNQIRDGKFFEARGLVMRDLTKENLFNEHLNSQPDPVLLGYLFHFLKYGNNLDTTPSRYVIKPVDTSGGFGVLIVDRDEMRRDEKKLELLTATMFRHLMAGRTLIIENFVEPAPLRLDGQDVDWNLRVFATRDIHGNIVLEDEAVLRYDKKMRVVNISKDAKVMRLSAVSDQIPHYSQFLNAIFEVTSDAISALEQQLMDSMKDLDPSGATPIPTHPMKNDYFGLDIIVHQDANGHYIPLVMEMNGANSGGTWTLESTLPPELQGVTCRKFAARILSQAQLNFDKRL